MLVLDSGAVSRLAERSQGAAALIRTLRDADLWPPVVPTVVLAESLTGRPGRDATTNRFLRTCLLKSSIPEGLARRAALLRYRAGRGSAVDAIVVALSEPSGVVLTQDLDDLRALASRAVGVSVQRV